MKIQPHFYNYPRKVFSVIFPTEIVSHTHVHADYSDTIYRQSLQSLQT